MLESTGFSYSSTPSSTLGIENVKVSSGLFKEYFLPKTEIKEVKIKGQDIPYLNDINREPLSFDLTFSMETWTESTIRQLARTFFVDDYKEMIFDDYPNTVFYCMPEGSSDLLHNGCQTGYINFTMRCSDSYSYLVAATPTFYSATPTFSINNTGDLTIFPEIEITKIGAGNVTLTNITNGQYFTFTGLSNNEIVYINCETELILTDLPLTYRYSAMTGDFIKLERGTNNFSITGDCVLEFRYQGKLLQS